MPFTSEAIARDVFLLGVSGLEDFTSEELIQALEESDDLYYNSFAEADGVTATGSFLTDGEYDSVRTFAEIVAPHHSYFTGIGAEVRGGKIKLPYPMGSLDQVEIGDITDWVGNWTLQEEDFIVTDKLDGTSAMVIYDSVGQLQIAYSRGNGTEGADITRHLKRFIPLTVSQPGLVIRGEVLLTKDDFKYLQPRVLSRAGTPYKNARNMVAGLMNAETNNPLVYEHLQFVAYEIMGDHEHNKSHILTLLREAGFRTPTNTVWYGSSLTDSSLAEYLNKRREVAEFEIDGLVLDVNNRATRRRMNPSRETLNPAYSIKYKVADESNQAITECLGVEWNVSKHGYWKPRVILDPVDLVGVTIQHATGFNAKFIVDHGIGPGARIRITRSGDVIPFITGVVERAEPQLPDVDYEWNDTGVDIVASNPEEHKEIVINQMTDFFATIDAPYLKKGNVTKLYDAGYTSTERVIEADASELANVLGSNGHKVAAGLKEKLTNIPLYKVMGATHFFGRGVGVRKFKKLLQAIGHETVIFVVQETIHDIIKVDGFEVITAEKIINGMDRFVSWLAPLEARGLITVQYQMEDTGSTMKDEKVVFTGFRNKELAAEVEAQGGTMQSGVSGKTTILVASNPNSNSGKMKKAREKGVRVMGIEEFKELLA